MKWIVGACAALSLAAASASIGSTPARAEVIYPWCLTLVVDAFDAVKNCGFVSYEQCKMSMFGPDVCSPNYAYLVAAGKKVLPALTRGDPLPPIHR